MTTKALTKKTGNQAIGAHGYQKPITVKSVMILDTGDGSFTDDSVKVKPHRTDANKLVLKCVDLDRLMAAVKRMGLKIVTAPTKGKKHFIVFCWKTGFGEALLAQQNGPAALGAGKAAQLPAPNAKQLMGKKS